MDGATDGPASERERGGTRASGVGEGRGACSRFHRGVKRHGTPTRKLVLVGRKGNRAEKRKRKENGLGRGGGWTAAGTGGWTIVGEWKREREGPAYGRVLPERASNGKEIRKKKKQRPGREERENAREEKRGVRGNGGSSGGKHRDGGRKRKRASVFRETDTRTRRRSGRGRAGRTKDRGLGSA